MKMINTMLLACVIYAKEAEKPITSAFQKYSLPTYDSKSKEPIEYECTQANLFLADKVDGYDGGQCQMVKNGACKPESNFDFSAMYFCEF